MRRMFYNDDGDTCISSYEEPFVQHMVTDAADVLTNTPITTLCYCVTPSDSTNYPSKVASMAGWRKVPLHEASPHFRKQYAFYQFARTQSWDIPAMVQAQCAKTGLEFIPSMRMNDGHFAQKVHPTIHPWTGEFWMQHQQLAIGPADFTLWGNQYLLDFRHAEVRDWKRAHCFEIIDRYASHGFEMDWTRHYTYFKPGHEQPEGLTQLLRDARQRLDQKHPSRRRPLIVRVAATVELSRSRGFDVERWIREGLIDYIIPTDPSRYIGLDAPIADWIAMARGTGVEVHYSPESAAHWGNGTATADMYRGAASNYYTMGAQGIYLFNLFTRGYPLAEDAYAIMRDIARPDALSGTSKHFISQPSPNQWRKDADTLPVTLSSSRPDARLGLFIGDDLASAFRAGILNQPMLRLRFDRWNAGNELNVWLNGTRLDASRVRQITPQWRRPAEWTWEFHTLGDNPGVWLAVDPPPGAFVRGDNEIKIQAVLHDDPVGLVGLDLPVTYRKPTL